MSELVLSIIDEHTLRSRAFDVLSGSWAGIGFGEVERDSGYQAWVLARCADLKGIFVSMVSDCEHLILGID